MKNGQLRNKCFCCCNASLYFLRMLIGFCHCIQGYSHKLFVSEASSHPKRKFYLSIARQDESFNTDSSTDIGSVICLVKICGSQGGKKIFLCVIGSSQEPSTIR